jgi:hypothetical protein
MHNSAHSAFFFLIGLQGCIYWGKKSLGVGISADVIWGNTMKRQEKKGENVKEKGRKGKENEKSGSKRVK